MSDKPISDLRRRILQDMTNRNFGAKTQHDYIRHIEMMGAVLWSAAERARQEVLLVNSGQHLSRGALERPVGDSWKPRWGASRQLARLCRGRHHRRQTSTHLQGATLTDPNVRITCIRFFTRKLSSDAVRRNQCPVRP